MVTPDRSKLRLANVSDAPAIAALHAESWRRFYRGAYSDAFLDGDVVADRSAVWDRRLREAAADTRTIVAEDDEKLLGFGHVVFDDDPTWGALLDNLHVTYREHGAGVGSRLLAELAAAVVERSTTSGLYLWVLEQNTAAQAFYRARGGAVVDQVPAEPPGGIPGRLNGTPAKLRCVWPEPVVLLRYRR
jgi:ribosomal protein S18 acetylase RimI-like enzyme